MKYLIKPKESSRRNNCGELFYDKDGHLKLNLILPKSYRPFLNELFADLTMLLNEKFKLVEPVARRGSAKGISSLAKQQVEVDEMLENLKKEFPGLKEKIKHGKEYMRLYSKEYSKIRHNKCIDCGKEVSWKGKRCPSCAAKFRYEVEELKDKKDKKECPVCKTLMAKWDIDKEHHPKQDRPTWYCRVCDTEKIFWDDGTYDIVS